MKKALTPLISTVLLLAFALGLGMLVISWGQASAQPASCSGVAVVQLDSLAQICVKDGHLTALLENTGEASVTHVRATLLSGNEVINDELDIVIAPGAFEWATFPSTAPAFLDKVRLLPSTSVGLCVDGKTDIENVISC
ncbi:MAG: hypothetical protein Q7S65_06205 [Nanoarchaeota archaeon]|nr:hypothetical protein [Nanoarchaeota archaeon]